jgi:hypothetical protein
MRRSKSVQVIKTDIKINPETRLPLKIELKTEMEKAKMKKSKSFMRCRSCQIIDHK